VHLRVRSHGQTLLASAPRATAADASEPS